VTLEESQLYNEEINNKIQAILSQNITIDDTFSSRT
jgi:hypothetical protein